jgi:hypothetical protein
MQCTLQVFHFIATLMGYIYLSIQPPPDTVTTGLFLLVSLTFHYTPRRGRPMRCTLQVIASLEGLPFLRHLDGLCSPLHPAAA